MCIPLSYSADDAESAVRVASGLIQKGILRERIRLVFVGVIETKSDRKYKETVEYMKSHVLLHIEGYIPIMDLYAEAQDFGKSLCEVNVPRLRTLARTVIDNIIDTAMQVKGA